MFSQTTEYALRAMVYLATTDPKPATRDEVAKACRAPSEYMAKVLNSLRAGGLLRSQRGKLGGFVLVRSAKEINLFDVVECVDPIKRVLVCPRDLNEHCTELCPLHRYLDDEAVRLIESLKSKSLHELATSSPKTFPNI